MYCISTCIYWRISPPAPQPLSVVIPEDVSENWIPCQNLLKIWFLKFSHHRWYSSCPQCHTPSFSRCFWPKQGDFLFHVSFLSEKQTNPFSALLVVELKVQVILKMSHKIGDHVVPWWWWWWWWWWQEWGYFGRIFSAIRSKFLNGHHLLTTISWCM